MQFGWSVDQALVSFPAQCKAKPVIPALRTWRQGNQNSFSGIIVCKGPGMVGHAFNYSTPEQRQ